MKNICKFFFIIIIYLFLLIWNVHLFIYAVLFFDVLSKYHYMWTWQSFSTIVLEYFIDLQSLLYMNQYMNHKDMKKS